MDSSPKELCNSPYHHQKVRAGEIRLLTILWTTADEFSLQTQCHELSEGLDFDAISYAWGTAPASVAVRCNDATMYITPTVCEILRYLSQFKPDPERPIWIDAICINQGDAEEKAVQVPQMRQVYSLARSVVVWLRSPTEESYALIKGLNEDPGLWVGEAALGFIKSCWPSEHDAFWKGMVYLLTSDWFRRLWTFQEMALAGEAILLCGTVWMDLDRLLALARGFYEDPTHFFGLRIFVDYGAANELYNTLFGRRCAPMAMRHIPALLDSLRCRHVGEQVDRVWALYGLFDTDLQDALAPLIDYGQSARAEHWRAVINCLRLSTQISQRLTVLVVPPSQYPRPSYLPSWCPDYRGRGACQKLFSNSWNSPVKLSKTHNPRFLNNEDEEVTAKRMSAIESHPKIHIATSSCPDILSCGGFQIDAVDEVVEHPSLLEAWTYTTDEKPRKKLFDSGNPLHVAAMSWLAKGLDLAHRIYPTHSEDSSNILWEFLMAFWTDHRVNEVALRAYEDGMAVLEKGDFDDIYHIPCGERRMQAIACTAQFQQIVGYSFFSTVGGRFGIATPGCRSGDKLCVFFGAPSLHVIRPHRTDSARVEATRDLWDFVGTAYVPHLMDQHTNDDARQGPDRLFTMI